MPFLPITREEMQQYGWHYADIIIVTGDAYVDHPSFGTAIISRVLENAGFKVCIIPQPKNDEDFKRFGKPKLAFFVNGGNIDSMVAHYTAAKKKRSEDAYTPGGKAGTRPDRAVIVYSNRIREAYGSVPIIIGGLEASLRRFAHARPHFGNSCSGSRVYSAHFAFALHHSLGYKAAAPRREDSITPFGHH